MAIHHRLTLSIGLLALCLARSGSAVELKIFGDVSLRDVDSGPGRDDRSFALGAVDLFVAGRLGERIAAGAELVAERVDGELILEVERLWIEYAASPRLKVAAGRFHTSFGAWNRKFHHGVLLQDTLSRPFFLEFEDDADGILPVHLIGVQLRGDEWTEGNDRFGYELMVGNGPTLDSSAGFRPAADARPELEPNDTENSDDRFNAVLRLSWSPARWPLEVGAFGNVNSVGESGDPARGALLSPGEELIAQRTFGADLHVDGKRWALLAEVFRIANESRIGRRGSTTGTAFYVQPTIVLAPGWRASYRYARLDFDQDDAYFALLGSREQARHLVALRREINEWNALTLEAERTDGLPQDETSVRLGWSFLIP